MNKEYLETYSYGFLYNDKSKRRRYCKMKSSRDMAGRRAEFAKLYTYSTGGMQNTSREKRIWEADFFVT